MKKPIITITITILIVITMLIVNKTSLDSISKVRVCIAEKTGLVSSIISKGYIEAEDKRELFIELPLRVEKTHVKQGDKVCKGDILARFDLSDIEIDLKKASANAQMEEIMLSELVKNNSIDIENIDSDLFGFAAGMIEEENINISIEDIKDSIEVQKKKVDVANIKVEEYEKKLKRQDKYLRSPIDGVITSLNISKGKFADISNPVAVISDISKLQVNLEVDEYFIADVKIGQKVTIIPKAFENKEFTGEVKYISPYAQRKFSGKSEDVVVEVVVEISDIENTLKPGYSVEAKIITNEKEEVLLVPYETILQDDNGKDYICIVQDNNFVVKKYVLIGSELDFEVEIIKGIKEGDVIIINPNEDIDSKVKIAEFVKR